MDKTPEEIEAERLAAEETARVAAEAETTRLAEEAEAARVAAEGKTPEELEAEAEATRLAAEEAAKATAPKDDWKDKRIATLTARLAAQAPKAEAPKDGEEPKDSVPLAEVERLANEKAQKIADKAAFNARCNAAAQEGRKVFPDFDASVKELAKVLDPNDAAERQAYDRFLEAALETGEAHKVIYSLGRDLDEFSRVMALGPVQQAKVLVELASADAKQVSNLPKPITPVQGKNSGPSEISPSDPARSDKLSSTEWHKRREAEVASRSPTYERRQAGR